MTTRHELDRLNDPDDALTASEIGDMERDLAEQREQQQREGAS